MWETEAEGSLTIQNQPGLHSKFRPGQLGITVRKEKKRNHNKQANKQRTEVGTEMIGYGCIVRGGTTMSEKKWSWDHMQW